MNIFFWVLQILLALHTLTDAIWKFSNSEQAVPSLNSIPHSLWLALSGIEILCAIGLILPAFSQKLHRLVPLSAILIAVEMIAFCLIHLMSGDPDSSPMIYWVVVAAISAFIAYGRFSLKPHHE